MKTLATLFALIFVSSLAVSAQYIKEVDGLYLADSTPYTGTYKSYYDNFNPKVEMNLDQGKKDGITKLFFEDGSINEIRSYKNNLMDGTWITYNEKGLKIAEADYTKGKKDGTWKIWDDNGTLRVEMTYNKGKKTGVWKQWNEEGKLLGEKAYN